MSGADWRDPTIADVRRAAALLDGQVVRTPTVRSDGLSAIVAREVWLKLEQLQRTGSFKIRGATVKVAALDAAERQRGVICVSAGNHAIATAGAAHAGRGRGPRGARGSAAGGQRARA